MLESMTGYGSAERVENGVRILAELRSVNNRFAEIGVKLPRQLSAYELEVRDLVRSRFQRGKISVFIQLQAERDQSISVVVNSAKVKAYRDLLETVRVEAGIAAPVSLEHLLKFSEIFDTETGREENSGWLWSVVRDVLPEAADALKAMRRREGEELSQDFEARMAGIEATLVAIRRLAADNLEQIRSRLAAKVEGIAGRDIAYNRERLEMELVLAADRLDITEELTRFASHNKFFLEELHNSESGTGRKLNFLLQEQLREANTIASKSQSAEISQQIVHIKEELEKIREQLQNIE
ncbi:MAG: YicC family protein [Chlorobium sp.]|uniref:YicC/YloC family endoribonuclease n=1 Tax=Chlorobium sp. TaxID=1095 RepID=UPI0025BE3B70|nr:YicC/YloC family endoribonuclease [Chlorobium sp.]MCF8217004.1 YicC family protein [Chlorobium sp.]MCF8271834.1 YicC family protein [Chlorobium sp.]MCF8288221.1 YicC family protein [Chlorobium sp.]MCF8291790.1 YicC family protein [Chlorobium sp.]MCF8385898.1 YicC family protein [Chlorobium sp.]